VYFRGQTPAAKLLPLLIFCNILGRHEFQRLRARLEMLDRRPTALHAVVIRRVRHNVPHRFVICSPVLLQQRGKDIVAIPEAFV